MPASETQGTWAGPPLPSLGFQDKTDLSVWPVSCGEGIGGIGEVLGSFSDSGGVVPCVSALG